MMPSGRSTSARPRPGWPSGWKLQGRARVFSVYPPDTSNKAHSDTYVAEASARLSRLAAMAREAGFHLLMENEKDIVGDTPGRCHAILSAVESPALRFAWDPANFVQVGIEQPTGRWWSLLAPYIAYVHVKDAVLVDGSVRAAGEGDGQIPELLRVLCDSGYRGVLALEPHLAFAGHSSGFSGEDGMAYAAKKLWEVMAEVGCAES
ncbi:MAG TPA: hypothetical protein DEP84_11040 [Chloroflexi bacterium]|nr:hypothetical protein [Chloroflexota bacterium]